MRHLTLFACVLAFVSPVLAQQPTPQASPTPPDAGGSNNGPFWRCVLPGGVFMVPVRMITSISAHEFVVDGVARVAEVNVATYGSVLARFYFIEQIDPTTPVGVGQSAINVLQDKLKEGADRTGQDELWRKVVKNYPGATHAHTVEYRLDSRKDLMDLFESAEEAWMRNRTREFKRPSGLSDTPK